MIAVESARSLSGIDLVRRIMHGEIPPPPIFDLVDFHLSEVEPGEVSGEFQPFEFHDYPMGGAHGGVISTLLDSVTVRGKRFPQEDSPNEIGQAIADWLRKLTSASSEILARSNPCRSASSGVTAS
jgi:hypothetical protein